jgi:hypothetical protein
MNPTEYDEKLFALFVTVMVGTIATTIVSWKVLDVILKQLERGKNLTALLTALTVGGIVTVFASVGGGLWLGYHYIRPEANKPEPPRPPESQLAPVTPPLATRTPSRTEHAFRGRPRSGRRSAQPPAAAETPQASNASLPTETSQMPDAEQPSQAPSKQTPATERRQLLAPAPACTTPPSLAPITIPPAEKSPEQEYLFDVGRLDAGSARGRRVLAYHTG